MTETPDTPSLTILVHEGQDGWLFLLTGSNFVASLYEREGDNLPDRALLRWRDITAARARRCAALGIRCLFVVVPDKLTIYDHKTATPLVDPALAPAVRLREQIEAAGQSADYLDLVSPMRAARDEQALYWRTDSHWSPEGCFLAYRAICKKLDLVADETLLTRPFIDEHRVMDLGGWVEPHKAETIRAYRYLQRSTRTATNRITRFLEDPLYEERFHTGARSWFTNPHAQNPQRVLLIGDSYSGQGAKYLTGMLAETVRSLQFVWSASADWPAVRWARPDIVIFEIAERFLLGEPGDGINWTLLEWKQAFRARQIRREHRRASPKATT